MERIASQFICRHGSFAARFLYFHPIVVSELVGLTYIKTIGVHLNMPRSLDYLKGSFSGNPSLHDGRGKAKQIFEESNPVTRDCFHCGMRATAWILN